MIELQRSCDGVQDDVGRAEQIVESSKLEGTSREEALAANSGNVWQTRPLENVGIPGNGNVRQRVATPGADFASRRSPVRSRFAPPKRPASKHVSVST
jgi:hypothetical protein